MAPFMDAAATYLKCPRWENIQLRLALSPFERGGSGCAITVMEAWTEAARLGIATTTRLWADSCVLLSADILLASLIVVVAVRSGWSKDFILSADRPPTREMSNLSLSAARTGAEASSDEREAGLMARITTAAWWMPWRLLFCRILRLGCCGRAALR